MKRSYDVKKFYVVDFAGGGKVCRRSFASPIAADIYRAKRERDSGKTLHVAAGGELKQYPEFD